MGKKIRGLDINFSYYHAKFKTNWLKIMEVKAKKTSGASRGSEYTCVAQLVKIINLLTCSGCEFPSRRVNSRNININ